MKETAVRRYVPETVSREENRQQTGSRAPRVSLRLGEALVLHDRIQPWEGPWVCYEGRMGNEPFRMFAAQPLLAVLAAQEGGTESSLTPEMQALFSILAVEACFARLERALATEIRFLRMGQALPPGDARYAVLEAHGQSWPVALQAPRALLAALIDLWPLAPLPEHAVFVRTALRIGKTTLPLAVLSSLHSGDVVLFEEGSPARAALVVENHGQARAQWDEAKGWVLESGMTYPEKKEGLVDEPDKNRTPNGMQTATDDVTSDMELPVTISFEMGQQTITLAELRALGPGSVLALPAPVKTPIRLCVGGRQIGTGELVDVEGAAGVRVVRIFGRE